MRPHERRGGLRAWCLGAAVVAVFAPSLLEGGVELRFGGASIAVFASLVAVWVLAGGTGSGDSPPRSPDPTSTWQRLPRVAAGVFVGVVALQALPWPMPLRRALAPGQAAWFDVAGAAPLSGEALLRWLDGLATLDVEAALGATTPWAASALDRTTSSSAWHPGAVDTEAHVWGATQLGALFLAGLVGRAVGRREGTTRALAVGWVTLGVAEAVFGLLHRNGPSTGLGEKLFYLGSATGTFVHRGQFAALLVLALGATWGLAASLFPLLPEEVRRHAARVRRSSQPPGVLEASGDKVPRLLFLSLVGAVIGLGLVAAQSRGALMSFMVVGLAVGVRMRARREERWHLGIAGGLFVSGAILSTLALGPRGAFGRFAGVLRGDDISLTSRLAVWRESVDAWLDAPVFGHGLGSWSTVWALHERGTHLYAFTHAHGELVEWLVETGVVGVGALLALVVAWVRHVARRLDTAPQVPQTAMALGLSVGVGAVAVQALADISLRAPGVALPWALAAGVVFGALEGEGGEGRPHGAPTRLAAALLSIGVTCGAGWTALRDARAVGTRTQRVGEVHRAWYRGDGPPVDAAAWRGEADAAVRDAPLDPWAHAGRARAYLEDALRASASAAPDAEARILDVEASLARAEALRCGGSSPCAAPRDPRLELARGWILDALASVSVTPDAGRARAVETLANAVALDGWRAEESLRAASTASLDDLERIADAAGRRSSLPPRMAARVKYQLGRALETRASGPGLRDEARARADAAYAAAERVDPALGPPAFARGVLLRAASPAAARESFRRALVGQEMSPVMLGWSHVFLEEPEAAAQRFESVLVGDPRHRWALEGMAAVAGLRGDAALELKTWRRIAALAPQDANVRARVEALTRGDAAASATVRGTAAESALPATDGSGRRAGPALEDPGSPKER